MFVGLLHSSFHFLAIPGAILSVVVGTEVDAGLTCLCFGFFEHTIYTLPFLTQSA
jgi:hypothetical protein